MVGFDYAKLNEYRVNELHREAAGIVAARQVSNGGLAKRVARGLRAVAARIDRDSAATAPQPQFTQLRNLTR